MNDCGVRLANLKQTTRNLNSDFNTFDRQLNMIERWLHNRPTIDDYDSIMANEEDINGLDTTDNEGRKEDEKNQQLIKLVLSTDERVESYGYEEIDNSYLNVTIRPPINDTHLNCPSISFWSNDPSSFVSSNSENDISLSHYSFSSGYSTN